jgi:hypothetical protein
MGGDYLVMELLEGENLATFKESRRSGAARRDVPGCGRVARAASRHFTEQGLPSINVVLNWRKALGSGL